MKTTKELNTKLMILQLSSPFLQPVSIIIGEKLAVYQEPTYR